MKPFDYLAPQSLSEALTMLAQRPEARPLAGGTDILVQMKEAGRSVDALLSLKRVPEVRQLSLNGSLAMGAGVKLGQLAADPAVRRHFFALADGAGVIGSVQIRNMATVGGNICNAAPSADTAPPLLVLNAQVVIAGPTGERTLPLDEFFIGPGQTALQPGELLKEIVVPRLPERSGSFYLRHTPRAWMDIAVVGVAAAVTLNDDDTIADARLALGAVAPTPIRASDAAAMLIGQTVSDSLLEVVGSAAAQAASPIDDLRASAAYRRHLVNVLAQRAVRSAIARAKGGQS